MADFDEGISVGILLGRKKCECGNTRPDKLTYKDTDPDYELPDGIIPAENETFDTVTEYFAEKDKTNVFGVGIINKDSNSESVSRLIYPDGHELILEGWDDYL